MNSKDSLVKNINFYGLIKKTYVIINIIVFFSRILINDELK